MNKTTEPKYYELSEDTLNFVENVVKDMSLPVMFNITYIGASKLKALIKLQKLSDALTHITNGTNLIIYINEDYFDALGEENSKILIYQELDRLEYNLETGNFKITKFKLQTNPGVLKKFGIDAVTKANQVAEVYAEQNEDTSSDELEQQVKNMELKSKSFEILN